MKILVVDDEPNIADSFRQILSGWGFEAEVAYNAEQALAFVREVSPDLVLTDICMPGRDGLDMAEEIHQHWPSCKFVLMSGHPWDVDKLEHMRRTGYNLELLDKPFHPAELKQHLQPMQA